MADQKRTPTKITDPTGKTVAGNVRRYREGLPLSTYELAERLKGAGRPIAPSAIAKLERGERRVDVGDLMALAAALEVSPISLLMPRNAKEPAAITGGGTVHGKTAWRWAQAREMLRYPTNADEETRHRMRSLYLLRVTPQGMGWDLTTDEGQRASVESLRAAFGEGADSGESLD